MVVKKFSINGKFYAQNITGVQRFAREIVLELDKIVENVDVEIVVPADAKQVPDLKNISIVKSRWAKSIFWEQVWLPLYLLKNRRIGLHLCHVAPIFKPDIVCIHDANILVNPQWFTRKVCAWYGLIDCLCAKFAKKIITVSEFSKKELQKSLGIPDLKILSIVEGWQHLNKIIADDSALTRYELNKGQFYFSLGTRAPHKNVRWIFEYARKHPEQLFVLSGSSYGRIFGKMDEIEPENVRFLGYLSDGEIKLLMQNCKAFVFPSFYEGFGLPPLEALSVGASVVVSDIPVMHEIFSNTVHYIDSHNASVGLEKLLSEPVESAEVVLKKYSWENAAVSLRNIIKEIA